MNATSLTGYRTAFLVIALAVVGWAVVGSFYHFIPCHTDCGETFVAELQARNARLFGNPFSLVEDHATSPDIKAHPYAYTHNVNIAGVIFPVLQLIGVDSLFVKQLVTLLAFALGLFFVFKVVEEQSRSKTLALVVLILFSTEYRHVLAWGLAALRAWHWLGLFGTLYFALRLVQKPKQDRTRNTGLLLLMLFISFGIGYDFYALTLAVSVFALLFSTGFKALRAIVLLVGLSFTPFVLRQIQVALVMGGDYWLKDFQYSILIKVPGAARLFGMPAMEQIEQFYVQENVLRPYATPAQSLGELVTYALGILKDWTLPTTGIISFILMLIVFTGAWTLFLAQGGRNLRRYLSPMLPWTVPPARKWFLPGLALVSVFVLATVPFLGKSSLLLLAGLAWLLMLGYALYRTGVMPAQTFVGPGTSSPLRTIFEWAHNGGARLGLLGVITSIPVLAVIYWYFHPAIGWRDFITEMIPGGIAGQLSAGIAIGAVGLAAAVGLINIVRNNGWAHSQNAEQQASRKAIIWLLAALSLGILVGMAIFMPLSIIFYMKHQFPLLAAPLLIAKGLAIWYFANKGMEARNSFVRYGAIALVVLFVGDHIAVQVHNYTNRREMDVSWIPEVAKRKNGSFAVSWIAPSVAAFTENWVMGIIPGLQDQILQRMHRGAAPFLEKDMFYFGEKDKQERLNEYLRPDYWLYFRIYYDAGYDCRKYDPLSALVRSFYRRFLTPYGPPIIKDRAGIAGDNKRGPGSWGRLTGVLQSNPEAIARIDALHGSFVASSTADEDVFSTIKGMASNPSLSRGSINCQNGAYSANWQIPETIKFPSAPKNSQYIVPIRVTYRDGRAFVVDFVRLSLAPEYPVYAPPGIHDQLPQIEELVKEYPDINIVARGREYMLVDMRPYYRKSAP